MSAPQIERVLHRKRHDGVRCEVPALHPRHRPMAPLIGHENINSSFSAPLGMASQHHRSAGAGRLVIGPERLHPVSQR